MGLGRYFLTKKERREAKDMGAYKLFRPAVKTRTMLAKIRLVEQEARRRAEAERQRQEAARKKREQEADRRALEEAKKNRAKRPPQAASPAQAAARAPKTPVRAKAGARQQPPAYGQHISLEPQRYSPRTPHPQPAARVIWHVPGIRPVEDKPKRHIEVRPVAETRVKTGPHIVPPKRMTDAEREGLAKKRSEEGAQERELKREGTEKFRLLAEADRLKEEMREWELRRAGKEKMKKIIKEKD